MIELVWVTRSGDATPVESGWAFDPGSGFLGWSLSPSSDRVAVKERTPDGSDIWIKALPDGPHSRLTFDEAIDAKPRWSPDGASVTFLSNRSGSANVWSRRADGTGEAELLFAYQPVSGDGFWSPDDEWLVLRTAGALGGGARDILAVRPSTDSVPLPLLASPDHAEQGPALSPDGRWLAYSSDETGRHEIFVRPFPDVEAGKTQVSTDGGIKPMWGHSGRELFYAGGSAAAPSLISASVRAEVGFTVLGREVLFPIAPGTVISPNWDFYDVAPDDQRFLMARSTTMGATEEQTPELILVQNFFQELKRLVPN